MLPRRHDEQVTPCTGFVELPMGTAERRQSVFHQPDDGLPRIKKGTHDGFLALGDGWRHMNTTAMGHEQRMLRLLPKRLVGDASRALYDGLVGDVKEETVAQDAVGMGAVTDIKLDTEQVGVLPPHQQSAGVVFQIVLPVVQLAFVVEDAVVETWGEKEAWLGLRHSRNRLNGLCMNRLRGGR